MTATLLLPVDCCPRCLSSAVQTIVHPDAVLPASPTGIYANYTCTRCSNQLVHGLGSGRYHHPMPRMPSMYSTERTGSVTGFKAPRNVMDQSDLLLHQPGAAPKSGPYLADIDIDHLNGREAADHERDLLFEARLGERLEAADGILGGLIRQPKL